MGKPINVFNALGHPVKVKDANNNGKIDAHDKAVVVSETFVGDDGNTYSQNEEIPYAVYKSLIGINKNDIRRFKGQFFVSYLQRFLHLGYRKIEVRISDETAKPNAMAYVKSWTRGFPNADVKIIVSSKGTTGEVVNGYKIIRYGR